MHLRRTDRGVGGGRKELVYVKVDSVWTRRECVESEQKVRVGGEIEECLGGAHSRGHKQ